MKPRIYMKGRFFDCGWEYQWWICAGGMITGGGSSPKAAYDDWLLKALKA
jgi:hypothetical protein